MHNRIKLVRTGNESFDVYYQSTGGNDYCNFVLVGQSGIDITIITTGTSSIPEDIYKESYYYPLHFGDIYGSLKGNADTATKATQDGNGNNIANTYQNKTKPIPFNNSSDAINIDNYPQAEYGTVVIWYNRAEADGAPPGQEGVIYQTKYRSELGESGSTYVDCLTQLYVGSGGIKHRTAIDYDEAAPFDGIPWS